MVVMYLPARMLQAAFVDSSGVRMVKLLPRVGILVFFSLLLITEQEQAVVVVVVVVTVMDAILSEMLLPSSSLDRIRSYLLRFF